MSGRTIEDCAKSGVPFVADLARERPGKAVVSSAAALYRWLSCSTLTPHLGFSVPSALRSTVLSGDPGMHDGPAYLTLDVPLRFIIGKRHARWLLAGSWEAGLSNREDAWQG
jgi:hypothetical protein